MHGWILLRKLGCMHKQQSKPICMRTSMRGTRSIGHLLAGILPHFSAANFQQFSEPVIAIVGAVMMVMMHRGDGGDGWNSRLCKVVISQIAPVLMLVFVLACVFVLVCLCLCLLVCSSLRLCRRYVRVPAFDISIEIVHPSGGWRARLTDASTAKK